MNFRVKEGKPVGALFDAAHDLGSLDKAGRERAAELVRKVRGGQRPTIRELGEVLRLRKAAVQRGARQGAGGSFEDKVAAVAAQIRRAKEVLR